uniref:Uncharacterized protein n=1 Tax=Acrobeloides nanus TaxID=290746 RepID=A0A914D188_9BILA
MTPRSSKMDFTVKRYAQNTKVLKLSGMTPYTQYKNFCLNNVICYDGEKGTSVSLEEEIKFRRQYVFEYKKAIIEELNDQPEQIDQVQCLKIITENNAKQAKMLQDTTIMQQSIATMLNEIKDQIMNHSMMIKSLQDSIPQNNKNINYEQDFNSETTINEMEKGDDGIKEIYDHQEKHYETFQASDNDQNINGKGCKNDNLNELENSDKIDEQETTIDEHAETMSNINEYEITDRENENMDAVHHRDEMINEPENEYESEQDINEQSNIEDEFKCEENIAKNDPCQNQNEFSERSEHASEQPFHNSDVQQEPYKLSVKKLYDRYQVNDANELSNEINEEFQQEPTQTSETDSSTFNDEFLKGQKNEYLILMFGERDITLRFIDTPGIDDNLDIEENKRNFDDILHRYPNIDYICCCLHPNISRGTEAAFPKRENTSLILIFEDL